MALLWDYRAGRQTTTSRNRVEVLALGFADNENGIINKPRGSQNPSPETVVFLISHLNFTTTREDVKTVWPTLLGLRPKERVEDGLSHGSSPSGWTAEL